MNNNNLLKVLFSVVVAAVFGLTSALWWSINSRIHEQSVEINRKVDQAVFNELRDRVLLQLERNERKIDKLTDMVSSQCRPYREVQQK